MHGKFLNMKIFNPASLRDADGRVFEELDVRRRINLDRRYQHIVDLVRGDTEGCKRSQWSLVLGAHHFSAFTKAAAPALIQFRKIRRGTSVDDGCLAVTANYGHPKI